MTPRDTLDDLIRAALAGTAAVLVCVGASQAAGRPHAHALNHRPHHARHALRPQRGLASYFGRRHAGELTASGKPLRPSKMVAASKTLPLGTKAKVTDLDTGKSVKVTVVDRGPYAKRRIIDVSPKAAKRLGMKRDGVDPVKVKPLHLPSSG